MFKTSAEELTPYLVLLFNHILDSGIYPVDWCTAILVPLHKSGSMENVNNFRGISLLSAMSKIFTKLLNKRLVTWAGNNNLLYEEQAGYRAGYSTVDQIFVLQSVVQKYVSKPRGRFYVAFIDFKSL